MNRRSALILAAGMSKRMGKPKQLLKINDQYLLEMIIHRVLSNQFSSVITVIGHETEEIKSRIKINNPAFKWLVNEKYKEGLGTSLKLGMNELLKESESMMIFLGDSPFFQGKTVETIYQVGMELKTTYKKPVFIQPTYQQKPGHPVFLGNMKPMLIRELKGDRGIKSILKSFAWEKGLININDPGIICDIDRPKDYQKLIGFYDKIKGRKTYKNG